MGDIKVGKQIAKKIQNIVINNPEEIKQIEASLRAIKEELFKMDMPEGINREQIVKPVDELLNAGKADQKDGNKVKEKLERLNENLGLINKTLNGIKSIAPYVQTIAKTFGIGSMFGL